MASRGKTDKAVAVLRKFERVNKTKIPQDVLDEFIVSSRKSQPNIVLRKDIIIIVPITFSTNFQLSSNRPRRSDEAVTVTTLFKTPELRTMMFLMVVSYISISLVFDGLVRMSENMGLDFFVTFTLAAATEIPSLALLTLVLDRYLLTSFKDKKIREYLLVPMLINNKYSISDGVVDFSCAEP